MTFGTQHFKNAAKLNVWCFPSCPLHHWLETGTLPVVTQTSSGLNLDLNVYFLFILSCRLKSWQDNDVVYLSLTIWLYLWEVDKINSFGLWLPVGRIWSWSVWDNRIKQLLWSSESFVFPFDITLNWKVKA